MARRALGDGAFLLIGFATSSAPALLDDLCGVIAEAPFRRLIMPNGRPMAVELTNCGAVGWTSTPRDFRYSATDPLTGRSWPTMPASFLALATAAAAAAGFPDYAPSVCIVHRYAIGANLHMHKDRDDTRDGQPVVSVSLGLPAVFRFGTRPGGDAITDLPVRHGDVMVWGGPSRMAYHGILPVAPGEHPLTGDVRLNLTFRTARLPRRGRLDSRGDGGTAADTHVRTHHR